MGLWDRKIKRQCTWDVLYKNKLVYTIRGKIGTVGFSDFGTEKSRGSAAWAVLHNNK